DPCHSVFDAHTRGVAPGQDEQAKCPPEGKTSCPLGLAPGSHKNGTDVSCEQVIRCVRCSFEHNHSGLDVSPPPAASSHTAVHSRNLIPDGAEWEPITTSTTSLPLGSR